MQHIYSCKKWNITEEETSYEIVFTDQILKYRKVYERFKNNHESREKYVIEKENRSEKEKKMEPM